LAILFVLAFFAAEKVTPHCDTMDGPVITEAKIALEKGNVTPVLKWVRKDDRDEIKKAFEKTLGVRKLSPQAKDIADMYFFETLVRIHRAAEGAGYTGLKPAGQVEPVIAAADKAIERGSLDDFAKEISALIISGIHQRFEHLMKTKNDMDKSVQAGREYVEAYVEFVHYVERLHNDSLAAAAPHAETEAKKPQPEHEH
jgi:microcompartment protein CcmL/EutN